MTRDDLMPVRAIMAPPETFDEAVSRVSNLCDNSMLALVGAMFIDIDQLQRAFRECKIKGEFEVLCDSGPVKTYRGEFVDPAGNTFEVLANAWSELSCQVINVRFAQASMDTDPKAVKLVHQTLKGEDRVTYLTEINRGSYGK